MITLTQDQREKALNTAKRAILEGWYGYNMDYQSGIVAAGEVLQKMLPGADVEELAVEIGNDAMTEIESEAA